MRRALGLMCFVLLGGCEAPDSGPIEPVSEYLTRFAEANPHDAFEVERAGYTLRGRHFAAIEPGGDAPVLMMHGFPDSQHLYDPLVPWIRATREVITFDFLGWGGSDKPDPADYTFDSAAWRADLEAVIAAFPRDRYVVVVHDASGWPGIDWAIENPDRVAALVILNAVYHPTESLRTPPGLDQYIGDSPERDALAARVEQDSTFWLDGHAEVPGFVGYREQLDRFMNDEIAQAQVMPIFEAESLAMRPAFLRFAQRAVAETNSRGERVARMATFEPTVRIVWGADDPDLNLGVAEDFAARFPRALLVEVPDANHYVQVDAPEVVAMEILAMD